MNHDQDRRDDDRTVFWEAFGNAIRPYAGWILYGFGALFVILGYFGIADEPIVAKQLPYLISGGIGGILLAVLGAYFLGIEELRRDSGRLDRIERQIEELHRALLERTDAPPREVLSAADDLTTRLSTVGSNGNHSADELADDQVLVVESGESFHRPGCSLAAGKQATSLSRDDAAARGLRPCRVCEPVVAAS